jgi:predicted metallopeptidase
MRYRYSEEWTQKAREIAALLQLAHIDLGRIAVIESKGSRSRRAIARIHALGKAMQLGLGTGPFYAIELIGERFNKQDNEDKIKTIIHELLHIPAGFGGGFRHHTQVNSKAVEREFQKIRTVYT